MKLNTTKLTLLLFAFLPLVAGSTYAQGTAFTYQGHLSDGGNPGNGVFALRFTIYDAVTSGNVAGGPLTNASVIVHDGLFTVTLDFGANVFNGSARWLEIGVRPGSSGNFTTLSPRQELQSTPYAIRAATTPAGGLSGTISPANIAAGTITTAMIANGAVRSPQLAAGAVGTAQLADGAVTANKVFMITNWGHPSHLVSVAHPGKQQFSGFGLAVAAVGTDKFVVGAQNDGSVANGGGAAYLFDFSGNLLATLTNPAASSGDSLGQTVAAVGTDRILVGAPSVGISEGAAYLFDTSGALVRTFTNPAPAIGSDFGWSLAGVGNDRVLIGALGTDPAGTAHLFSTNGSLLRTFTNPFPTVVVGFGRSVAAVGNDRVLIGAANDIAQTAGGLVFLFNTNGSLLTTFTNPTPAPGDLFGYSVAAVGSDKVLIGDITDASSQTIAGAAYLFSTNGTLLTTFTNPASSFGDYFGWQFAAVDNDKVLISALADDDGAVDTGSAYLFDLAGNLLATIRNPAPIAGDQFGYAVASIGADRILIGEVNGGPPTNRFGVAHLFTFTPHAPGLLADTVSGGGVTTPSLADEAVTTTKIADYAVMTEKLALGAVGTAQLAANAITTDRLTNGAVTVDKIFRATDWLQPLSAVIRTNPTPENNDEFGFSVARAGDTRLIVGAPKDSSGANVGGAVYLYNLSFGLVQSFNNPSPSTGDAFGYAVAGLDAERVLIGAYGDDAGAVDSGVAYLFRRQNPTLLITLTNPAPNTDDRFGIAVATVGPNYLLIGATGDDVGATDAGAAYLFNTNGTLLQTIANPAPTAGDYFGHALAGLGSDKFIIGAHGEDAGGTDSGRAYFFNTNGTLLTTFTNPAPGISNWFGYSVATVGADKVIIGAPANDVGAPNAGAAYLFSTNGSLLATFTKPVPVTGDNFGSSVAMVGSDRVMIGASGDDTGATNSGAAYVFDLAGNLLSTLVNPAPGVSDSFGASVAGVGTDLALVGAFADDTAGLNTGSVYLFPFASYAPGLLADGARAESINTFHLIDEAVTADKIGGVLYASQIPELDASKITTGVLHPDRIPGLDASKLTSGTLSDARLSSNVALKNQNNNFSASQSILRASAAAPGLSFVGDANTGLFSPDADIVALATGGAERLRVNSAGAVGIGETAPEGQLHITGPQSTPQIMIETTANNSFVKMRLESQGKPYWDFAVGGTANVMNWFYSGTSQNLMSLATNGTLTTVGPVNPPSDRNVKQDFAAVDARAVLEKVTALPIQSWAYKNSPDTRHIGPVAQDFHAAFQFNGDDDKHITTVDADGVALAAIQGLNAKVESGKQNAEMSIRELRAENAELKQTVNELKELVQTLNQKLSEGAR